MNIDFKKDTWLYALIAAILVIISVFTPASTWTYDWSALALPNVDVISWLSGSIGQADGDWTGVAASTYLLGSALICATLLLTFGILSWRGKELKWDWLVYVLCGVSLIIFPILYFVFAEPPNTYADLGLPVTVEDKMVSFAPIGILIAGIIAIAAFVVDKFLGGGE